MPRSCGKRGPEVARIDRDRAAVTKARRALSAHVTAHLASIDCAELAEQITTQRIVASKLAKSEEDDARSTAERILAELNLGSWASLVPEVQELLIAVALDGITVAFRQIGVKPTADLTDQVNAAAVEWAKDRAAELVGMRYNAAGDLIENPDAQWAITDGTRALLRGDVVRAIEEGTSSADLADALKGSYAFSPDRADMIARTELARADVEGNMMAYRDSGVVDGKEWVLGSEHDDDDECDDAAAMGVVPLDDDFGGIGDPPAHPKCACDVLPVLAEEA
jgi:hypothetical protein